MTNLKARGIYIYNQKRNVRRLKRTYVRISKSGVSLSNMHIDRVIFLENDCIFDLFYTLYNPAPRIFLIGG